jgi:hypothetical protein
MPLVDSHHFGETILNGYGRPFQEGFNSAAGMSGWTAFGPFVIYARGEYQHSPSAPSLSQNALNFISNIDGLPPNPPASPIPGIDRFRLLDAYVGMNLANWEISYGKQSLWWGPGDSGPMLLTSNIDPLNNMFRVTRVTPFRLPGILRFFGDIRMEFFLGQLAGQRFINNTGQFIVGTQGEYGHYLNPQPFLDGAKISFKFTQNLEFNMAKTAVYGGPGNPLTPKTFLQSMFGIHVNGASVGDGRVSWDFTYRIPKARHWLTLYGDILEEDEPFPINHLEKAAFQGGLYFAQIPKAPRVDLSLEGGSTSPVGFPACNACYYNNLQYVSGYVNQGNLIGSWIGRAAQGEAVRSNYWFRPKQKLGVEMRHRAIDRTYLPGGGSQNDVAVTVDFLLKSGLRFSGALQYERWQVPILAMGPQSNVSASFQFGYWPRAHAR